MSLTIDQLVSRISDDVIARMIEDGDVRSLRADGSREPLSMGAILLGPEFVNENAVWPRMVVIPKGGPFSPKWVLEQKGSRLASLDHVVGTYQTTGEIHVWGENFGDAEQLMKRFVLSLALLCPGNYAVTKADFNYSTLIAVTGRELVATFGVDVPIATTVAQRAPKGTQLGTLTASLTTKDNPTPETQP